MIKNIIDRTIPCPKLSVWWQIEPEDGEAIAKLLRVDPRAVFEGEVQLIRAKTAAEAFAKSKWDHTKMKLRARPVTKGKPGRFGLIRPKPLGAWVTSSEALAMAQEAAQ
jgi:hypothetical protein